MIKYAGKMNDLLETAAECLSSDEQRMLGLIPDNQQDEVLRSGAARSLQEDAIATSQQHVPLGSARSVDRKDMRPWQGKESDGEIMFNFESAIDAQDLYDFVLETGLVTPGEVKLYMSEHQTSVHFAPSVLVQKPDVIQMALIAFEEQAMEESLPAMDALAEAVSAVLEARPQVKAIRGSAEPRAGRGADFNPFHDTRGNFTTREGTMNGGSWSDGVGKGSRHMKATKKGKKLHFAATKLPCGRAARAAGKNTRCWDGQSIGGGMARAFGKKRRETKPRLMPGVKESYSVADRAAINECLALYGVRKRLSERDEEFLIIKRQGRRSMFYTGSGWSEEYPDAFLYGDYDKAMKVMKSKGGDEVLTTDEYDRGNY